MSSSPYVDDRGPGGLTPAVRWLLIVNVAVYFLQVTIISPEMIAGALGFSTTTMMTRIWTVVTYAFVHANFWHIALNMLGLWQFGPRVERLFGTARFVRFYLFCALGASALHGFVTGVVGSQRSLLVGASGAVFGVLYAFAHAWPRTMLLFFGVIPMQVRWYVAAFTVVSLVLGMDSMTNGGGGVAHFAHLGGLLTAVVLVRIPAGGILGRWQGRIARAPEEPEDIGSLAPRGGMMLPRQRPEPRDPADDAVARSNALTPKPRPAPSAPAPSRREPVAAAAPAVVAPVDARAAAQAEMDLMLDKISAGGLASLSADERARLDELSRRLREPR